MNRKSLASFAIPTYNYCKECKDYKNTHKPAFLDKKQLCSKHYSEYKKGEGKNE